MLSKAKNFMSTPLCITPTWNFHFPKYLIDRQLQGLYDTPNTNRPVPFFT